MPLAEGVTLGQAIMGGVGAVAAFAGAWGAMRAELRGLRRDMTQARQDAREWQRDHVQLFHTHG